ncbi:MAG: NAD(P)/FAD-dependent oxidoreductase [Pseudomonadota bacterium]
MRDVAIVGGSFAGLAAALQLARTGRDVVVIDACAPRNAMSPAAHGVPGSDGSAPSDILDRFRSDLAAYETVTLQQDRVIGITGAQDAFELDIAASERIAARRLILAHGVGDVLPDLPGIEACWGRTLLHCPYCHGHEARDRPLAVLAVHPMALHQAMMLRADWSEQITLLTGAGTDLDLSGLDRGLIDLEPREIIGLESDEDGIIVAFEDGARVQFAAVFTQPRVTLERTPAAFLDAQTAQGPLGPFIRVGAMGQTTVPGVFAAGDCARPGHAITLALGDGASAGIGCHQSLVFPDFVQPLEQAA